MFQPSVISSLVLPIQSLQIRRESYFNHTFPAQSDRSNRDALRAVLIKILSTTRIKTYPAWAILNAVCDADATASSGNWQSAVAEALKVVMGEVDEVLSQLCAAGLVGNNGSLTALGATELATGRSAVSAATSHLVDGITEKEQTTARLVLDHLRRKAEELLRL